MNVLGIESSCDETAVAVVRDGRKVLSNVIASQADLHALTGGVVPEVAAREHVKVIIPSLEKALLDAELKLEEIDLIAVSYGPGLVGSLLTGLSVAKTLSAVTKIPLVAVNHIDGHIHANWLDNDDEIEFPLLVMTISGGHNEIILMKDHLEYELVGETQDDAAGEVFDKIARVLGLGFPGGPVISKQAINGDKNRYKFPRAWLENIPRDSRPKKFSNYNFSFSGLKTAVIREIRNIDQYNVPIEDIAAGFQEAVVDVLATKLCFAAKEYNVKEVHLAGGVSANGELRKRVDLLLGKNHIVRYAKNLKYCTDNAAMIAGSGYFKYQKQGADDWREVVVSPGLRLVN